MNSDPVNSDAIIDEIHRFRREHAEKFNYDMDAIVRDLQSREGSLGNKVVSYPPKRLETTRATPNEENE